MSSAIKLEVGMRVLAGNDVVEILASVSTGKVQVKSIESGEVYLIKPGAIRAEIKTSRSGGSERKAKPENNLIHADELDEAEIEEAKRRFEIILAATVSGGSQAAKIAEIAARIGISKSRVHKILRDFDEEAGFAPLMRQKTGRKKMKRLLSPTLESIISEAINLSYKGLGATKASVARMVGELCFNAGLSPPSKRTIYNRINSTKASELAAMKYGKKESKQQFESRGGKVLVGRPLELVQMDHARSDLIVVDEHTRKPLGRPWLTFAIDLFTRVILGMYVSFDAPSGMTVALALANAILPKDRWLKAIGAENSEYPFYGLPKRVHVDNAKEFRSRVLIGGCDRYGINLTWRPPYQSYNGAHVERVFGTFMQKIHAIPGTTMSSVPERLDYDSESHSVFTLTEYRRWLVTEVELYHKTFHSGIKCTPLHKWEDAYRTTAGTLTHPDIVEDQLLLLLNFMPMARRTITRAGVKLFNIEYYNVALKRFDNGRRCVVRYDPGSMMRIWIKPEGEQDYLQLNYSDVTLPDVSLEELRYAKAVLKKISDDRTPYQDQVILAKENRERIEESTKATRKERLQNAKSSFRASDVSHPLYEERQAQNKEKKIIDYGRRPNILDSGY